LLALHGSLPATSSFFNLTSDSPLGIPGRTLRI
jgi:hypothetical protein